MAKTATAWRSIDFSQLSMKGEGFTALMEKVTKIESIYILKPLARGGKWCMKRTNYAKKKVSVRMNNGSTKKD